MSERNANRPGYKKTRVGWIPEEWEVENLSSISTIINSNVDKKTKANEEPVILCNYLDVYENERITDRLNFMEASASKTEIEKYSLRKNDVIITKDSETREDIASSAIVWQSIENLVCGYHLTIIRPIEKKVDGEFLSYRLSYGKTHRYFVTHANGATRYGLTLSTIHGAKIPLPLLPEQRRIAEILSTWDRAIEQTRQLIDAKQRLKKGLMQQLLTGRMRFPGFGAPVEKAGELPEGWEERKLSEVAKVIISGVDKKTKKDEIPVILCNYMDVFQNQYITSNCNFMFATATKSEIEKYKLQKNDVLLTKDSETREDIANSAIILENISNLICGYHLAILRPKEQFMDGLLLAYIINFGYFHNYFVTHANGVTRFGLTIESIKGLVVRIPNLGEQKKIASLLFSLDMEVESLEKVMHSIVQQKHGLMQKLLNGEKRAQM